MGLITISPTILTDDPNRYKQLVELYHPFTKRAQIDISDGTLAPSRTVPINTTWWPKGWLVDIHMMVMQPSLYLDILTKLKPNLVIFHSEVQEDLTTVFDTLRQNDIKVGLAILKPTFPGDVRQYIADADHVMIFSGELGQNGGAADLLQLEKVRIIKSIKKDVEIGWDGGANVSNVRTIAQAGVNVINVGNALASADNPAKTYTMLSAEAEKQGVM
ncbi:MAG: hypothetical protein LBT19_01840 [Candidatus Nomurabacteria bacterium]|jgi:ribulose-phosphate 3-epimerase|nr:hypothetical protein [Candidatus Nomurabacteria bacterium]